MSRRVTGARVRRGIGHRFAFFARVYDLVRRIPRGRITSYGANRPRARVLRGAHGRLGTQGLPG